MTNIIIIAAVAAALAGIAGWLITRAIYESRLEALREVNRQSEENFNRALKDMKETVMASVTAETEKILKRREEELTSGNNSAMDNILKPLKESIASMQKD